MDQYQEMLLAHINMMVDYYSRLDIDVKEKLQGLAFSILTALDGSGSVGGEIHGFSLRPININGEIIDSELAGKLHEFSNHPSVRVEPILPHPEQ